MGGDSFNTPAQSPDQRLDQSQGQTVSGQDSEVKTFAEQWAELKEQSKNRLQEIFDKHLSARLKEGEYHEVKKIQGAQENALKGIFKDYEEIQEEEKNQHTQARDELRKEIANDMLQKARQEADNRLSYIEAILATTLKNQTIQGNEIVPFHNFLLNLESVTEKDPNLLTLMKKLGNKNKLTPEDYKLIISRLEAGNLAQSVNPYAGIEDLKDAPEKERIESNNLGMILAMLTPAQRYEFIETLMFSDKKEKTGEILESMMKNGLLSSMQGQELTFLALSRSNLPTEQEHLENILDNIDEGLYQKQAQQVQEAIQEASKKNDEMFAVNPLERFLGGPFWAALMKIHSGMWLIANVLHNHADLQEEGGWARLATNPYVLGAIAEYGIAHEIETGGRKIGMGFGHGSVAEWFERLGDDGPASDEETKSYTLFYEAYTQSPNLGLFLEKGGGEIVMEAYEAKTKKYDDQERDDELRTFTLEDVFDFLEPQTKNDSHKNELFSLLNDAENQYAGTGTFIAEFPQIYEAMNLQNNTDLQKKLAEVRTVQNIKEPYDPAPQQLPDFSRGPERNDPSKSVPKPSDNKNLGAIPV